MECTVGVGVGADVGREDVVADGEARGLVVLRDHVDAVTRRARDGRPLYGAVREREQRIVPVVEQQPRERAVDAVVEDVPRMAVAVFRADDGRDKVRGRAGDEAARLAVDGRLGEETHDLTVML